VKVLTALPPADYQLVGIARFGSQDSLAGASMTLFTMPEAQRVNNSVDQFGEISVLANEGVSQDEVKADVVRALEANPETRDKYEVLTGTEITKENQNELRQQLSFIRIGLTMFALIALAVGAFIIYNTFSIVVAQRAREMALLRALGGSRRQVLGQVFGESVVVGLLASAAGVVVGIILSIALRWLLGFLGFALPSSGIVVPPSTVVTGIIVGTLVTVLSAVVPARRAARIPPIAALRDTAIERPPRRVLRFAIGGLAMAAGVAGLFIGLFGDTDAAAGLVGGGMVLIFLGAFVLGPLFAGPVSRIIAAPLPRMRGMAGRLARENAARNPKRTAITATSLLIGVALVGLITIFGASAKATIAHAVDSQFRSDYIVSGGGGFGPPQPLSPAIAREVSALPEVEVASGVRFGEAGIEGSNAFLNAIDPSAATQLLDLGDVAGSFSDVTADGIAVSDRKTEGHEWKIGDVLPVEFVRTGVQPLTIQYIYDENTFGDYFVSLDNWDKNFDQRVDYFVFAKLKAGVSPEQGREAIERVLEPFPTAKLQDNAQYKADQVQALNQFITIFYALLLMALVIALIGIANTLALSIHERIRELGLLRAVGMSKAQVRSTVRWESVIIALLGTVNGLAIGFLFGWALVRALRDSGFTEFAIAPVQLLLLVFVLAVASVVAALYPARRAANIDVLRAISTE
jgi:putative ABC transport system permease protein